MLSKFQLYFHTLCQTMIKVKLKTILNLFIQMFFSGGVLGYNETYLIISYFLEISNCLPNSAPPRRGLKHNFKEIYVAQISGLTKGFYQDVMKKCVIIILIFSMYFITKTHNLLFIKTLIILYKTSASLIL